MRWDSMLLNDEVEEPLLVARPKMLPCDVTPHREAPDSRSCDWVAELHNASAVDDQLRPLRRPLGWTSLSWLLGLLLRPTFRHRLLGLPTRRPSLFLLQPRPMSRYRRNFARCSLSRCQRPREQPCASSSRLGPRALQGGLMLITATQVSVSQSLSLVTM
jgi:hypothetical protein